MRIVHAVLAHAGAAAGVVEGLGPKVGSPLPPDSWLRSVFLPPGGTVGFCECRSALLLLPWSGSASIRGSRRVSSAATKRNARQT